MKNITGIILAGGQSSRMGRDKGLTTLRDKPMIQHVIDVLEQLSIPVIIIANNSEYNQFGKPVYSDLVANKGPVGGIYTGLKHSNTDTNVIISCDTPFVSPKLISFLLKTSKDHAVTIPSMEGKTHPLIGIYKKEGLNSFKSHLDKDQRKLMLICDDLSANVVDIDSTDIASEKTFTNINTQEELKKHDI